MSFNYVNLTCSLKSKAFIYSSTIHFNLLLFNGVFSPLKRKGCIMAVLPLTGKWEILLVLAVRFRWSGCAADISYRCLFFIALAFRVKAIADCCSTKLGKERESERDWFRSLFPWQRWCWQQGYGGVWHLFECSLIKWEKITSCGYWMEVAEIMLKLNDWVLVFSLLALVFFSSKWEIGSRWV